MKRRLLVDGYNVIHAHPDLSVLADDDMELARARLVELLAEHSSDAEVDVTVVFDGAGGHSPAPTRERVLGVTVMFSARGQSADAVVESLALSDPEPDRTTVATSDRATQEAVFARGALRMSARELVELLRDREARVMDAGPRPPATVADRLDAEVIARLRALTED